MVYQLSSNLTRLLKILKFLFLRDSRFVASMERNSLVAQFYELLKYLYKLRKKNVVGEVEVSNC